MKTKRIYKIFSFTFIAVLMATTPFCQLNGMKMPANHVATVTLECSICFNDTNDGVQLSCGHAFCKDCLRRIVNNAVKEQSTRTLVCPSTKPRCTRTLSLVEVAAITNNDGALINRLATILDRETLIREHDAQPCPGRPGKNCNAVLMRATPQEAQIARCGECERDYCNACFLPAEHHRGVNCARAQELYALSNHASPEEKATLELLRRNSKPCPRCNNAVEKNYGCNHMTCRCGHHFCWECRADWIDYGHRCAQVSLAQSTGWVAPAPAAAVNPTIPQPAFAPVPRAGGIPPAQPNADDALANLQQRINDLRRQNQTAIQQILENSERLEREQEEIRRNPQELNLEQTHRRRQEQELRHGKEERERNEAQQQQRQIAIEQARRAQGETEQREYQAEIEQAHRRQEEEQRAREEKIAQMHRLRQNAEQIARQAEIEQARFKQEVEQREREEAQRQQRQIAIEQARLKQEEEQREREEAQRQQRQIAIEQARLKQEEEQREREEAQRQRQIAIEQRRNRWEEEQRARQAEIEQMRLRQEAAQREHEEAQRQRQIAQEYRRNLDELQRTRQEAQSEHLQQQAEQRVAVTPHERPRPEGEIDNAGPLAAPVGAALWMKLAGRNAFAETTAALLTGYLMSQELDSQKKGADLAFKRNLYLPTILVGNACLHALYPQRAVVGSDQFYTALASWAVGVPAGMCLPKIISYFYGKKPVRQVQPIKEPVKSIAKPTAPMSKPTPKKLK